MQTSQPQPDKWVLSLGSLSATIEKPMPQRADLCVDSQQEPGTEPTSYTILGGFVKRHMFAAKGKAMCRFTRIFWWTGEDSNPRPLDS